MAGPWDVTDKMLAYVSERADAVACWIRVRCRLKLGSSVSRIARGTSQKLY